MYIEKRATNVEEVQNVQQPWVKIDEEFSQRDTVVKLVKNSWKREKILCKIVEIENQITNLRV